MGMERMYLKGAKTLKFIKKKPAYMEKSQEDGKWRKPIYILRCNRETESDLLEIREK